MKKMTISLLIATLTLVGLAFVNGTIETLGFEELEDPEYVRIGFEELEDPEYVRI